MKYGLDMTDKLNSNPLLTTTRLDATKFVLMTNQRSYTVQIKGDTDSKKYCCMFDVFFSGSFALTFFLKSEVVISWEFKNHLILFSSGSKIPV